MTQEEKRLLHEGQFKVERMLTMLHPPVIISKSMKEPSLVQLHDMLDCLRVFVKYGLLDLEATRRENAALEKALRDQR